MRPRISHLLLFWMITVLGSDSALARLQDPLPPGNGQESNPAEITREEVSKSIASLQRPFIENQGQFNGQAAYAIPLGNGNIFLDKHGALIFSFSRTRPAADGPPAPGPAPAPGAVSPPSAQESLVFRVIPESNGQGVAFQGRERAATVVNYFVGPRENWRGAIPTWNEVSYDGIFPGTRVVYRAGAGMVEDIYELQPGTDPSTIRYRVEGAERLELAQDGSLQIITPAGPFTVNPPVAFQEVEGKQRRIPCSFVISGLSYGFATEPYDSRLALVIDPQLVYGSFLGGAGSGGGSSQGYSIAVAGGKAYLAGTTDTALFPTTTGSYDPSFQGERDLTITIINPQGNSGADLVYSTFLGGSDSECLGGCNNFNGRRGIALDASGRIWLTGYTASTDFPSTTGAFQETHSGGDFREGFFTILDPQGSGVGDLVYSSYLGGTGYDDGFGIALADNKAWIIGTTTSTDLPTTAGAYDTTADTHGDAFFMVLNPQGNGGADLVYSTFLGGSLNESGYDIAVDGGKAWLTGYVGSSDFPVTTGAFSTSFGGQIDAFFSVINPQGTGAADLVYSTYLGSSVSDYGYSIAVAGGKAWLTGYTESSGFPVTGGALDTSFNGSPDAFLTIIDPQGGGGADLSYSTFLGGSKTDSGFSLVISGGKAWLSGITWSTDFPTSSGAFDTSFSVSNNTPDSFFAIIDPQGGGAADLAYATYLGGSGGEYGYGLAVADNKAWLTGHTYAADFPTTTGSFDPSYNGDSWNSYLTIINPLGSGTADLAYSTYLGADGGNDQGYGIALADGKVWLTGASVSPDFPLTPGAISTTPDLFLAIIDPRAGKNGLLYSTFFGGSSNDYPNSLVLADNKAWIAGDTTSADFPTSTGAYDASFNGSWDTFLTVISPQGNGTGDIAYSTYLGGDNGEIGADLAITNGWAWLSGATNSATFPTTASAFDPTFNGNMDAFLAILHPGNNGTADLIYSTFAGGTSDDLGMDIAVNEGKAWLTGDTSSTDFPTTANGYDTSHNGSTDTFLTVINPASQGGNDLFYSTYIGGIAEDHAMAIGVANNTGWLAGYTTSTNFPVTAGAYDTTSNGQEDIFLTLLNPAKSGGSGLAYSSYLGGDSQEYLFDLAVGDGRAWLTGFTASTDFPVTVNAYATSFAGGYSDAFLAVLAPQGKGSKDLFYSTYLGGQDHDQARAIALQEGTAWLVGTTWSMNFPFTSNGYDTSMTPPDAFVLAFEVYRKFPWPMFLPAISHGGTP